MQIVAVTNIKGGVGKTTTAVNLACLAAETGERYEQELAAYRNAVASARSRRSPGLEPPTRGLSMSLLQSLGHVAAAGFPGVDASGGPGVEAPQRLD